jgi:HlyD family secretion protein
MDLPDAGKKRAGRVRRRAATASAAALAAVGIGYCAVHRGPSSAGGAEPELKAYVVASTSLRETVVGTGTVEPALRVQVKSEVPGIVSALHVERDERVTVGQLLVSLDPSRLEAQRDELRAAVEVQRNLAAEELAAVAAARLDHARREFRRVEELAAGGVVSQRARDDARLEFETAQLGYSNAKHQAAARRSELERISRSLERVERDLERLEIRAPIAGILLERPVELGSPVADVSASNGGTLIATVADDSALHLLAAFDENDIRGVARGQPAEVRIDALADDVLPGKVTRIASSGRFERGATVFDVEISLPSEARLRVGMSGDARVVVATHADVLVVPSDSIVRGPDGPSVRRRSSSNGGFELTPIEEGYSDGLSTIVASGVRAGDTLLVPQARREP